MWIKQTTSHHTHARTHINTIQTNVVHVMKACFMNALSRWTKWSKGRDDDTQQMPSISADECTINVKRETAEIFCMRWVSSLYCIYSIHGYGELYVHARASEQERTIQVFFSSVPNVWWIDRYIYIYTMNTTYRRTQERYQRFVSCTYYLHYVLHVLPKLCWRIGKPSAKKNTRNNKNKSNTSSIDTPKLLNVLSACTFFSLSYSSRYLLHVVRLNHFASLNIVK